MQDRIQAAYEAALPRSDLWTLADFRDADAALLPEFRRRIRSRSRYEYANNSLYQRIIDVFVADVCGEDGPTLQVHSGVPECDRYIEQAWAQWWRLTNQAAKLQTAVRGEAVDGESVAVVIPNPRNSRFGSPLIDVRGFEADRLASPNFQATHLTNYVDGVHLDELTSEPVAYDLLKAHPGNAYFDALGDAFLAETFPAEQVLHAFRKRRAEQHRGVCRFAASLPLAGLLRQASEADVKTRQLRSVFAFVVRSLAPPNSDDDTDDSQWWQEIQLPNRQGAGLFLPDGYDINQLRTEAMSGELSGLQRIIGGAISGCVCMPVSRAIGEGKDGYAAVRGEMLPYHRTIASDRCQIWEPSYLRPLFWQFVTELRLAGELDDWPDARPERCEFCWPEKELVVDPSREESARENRLSTGMTNREDELQVPDIDAYDDRCARSWGFATRDEFRAALRAKVFGPAAAAPAPADAGGEFGQLGRRQFTNNAKAIRDILQRLIDGSDSEAVASQMLKTLGLSDVRVQALIDDARDASIDDPALQGTGPSDDSSPDAAHPPADG